MLLASTVRAQAPAADSVRPAAPLLLKAGLRLTHLHYAADNSSWQLLLPLSFGTEYRLSPGVSIYGQLETDVLATRTASRRRRTQQNPVSAATFSLGLRHYYGRPQPTNNTYVGPEFGKYLALEGAADWQQLSARYLSGTSRGRTPVALTPSLYALWGIQNRLRPHLLYDLNAGLGVLAPTRYYNFERTAQASRWDVSVQANVRLFFGY